MVALVVLNNRRRASLWIIGILTILSMIFVISFNRSSMKDFVGIYSSSVLWSDDGDFSGGGGGSSDRESTIVGEEGDDDDEVKTAKNAENEDDDENETENDKKMIWDEYEQTNDLTKKVREMILKNGWQAPKFYTRREGTDALKIFEKYEKEKESFDESSWRVVRAANGEGSTGVVYMATGNTRFIDRAAMVASRLRAHSKKSKIRFCLYTDKVLFDDWMKKLKLTHRKVELEGWDAVGVTDAAGWISPINSRKKYMKANPFDDVVFYDGLMDLVAEKKSIGQVERNIERRKKDGNTGTNLPLMFFLKKIISLAGAPYAKTIFADGDTCSCGDYVDDMLNELDGKYSNPMRDKAIELRKVPKGGYDFMHIVDPARNQGGNHLGYDLRDFYETEITIKDAKLRRVDRTFEERNVGFIVYRPNKLTTTLFRQFAEILMGTINHGKTVVKNEQPAYTETLWMWKDIIKERILNNRDDVCRKLSKSEKDYCQRPPFKPDKLSRVGPLCRRGCRFAHEKCECWKNRMLTMPLHVDNRTIIK